MNEPRPKELIRFLDLLTEDAPEGYEPYLFRVQAGSKAPDTSYGSWKAESARLSKAEAVRWMEQGGNVGLAGRGPCPNFDDSVEELEEHACDRCNGEDFSDRLINVDIDDEDETTADDLKDTLIARSRSRTGVHAWYFAADGADVPNIPTDDAGEVRANWQYVVAPGSYVDTDPAEVPDGEQDDAGYYTIEQETSVARLELDELPDVFQRANRDDGGLDENSMAAAAATDEPEVQDNRGNDRDDDRDSKSALFDISARDVAVKEGGDTSTGERWAAIFHDSETGKNMSLSNEGLLHCWRHNVAHNGLQALCVLSDYRGDCADVGSPHKHSNAGQTCLQGEEGEHIWHAWKYAKQRGYIPDDDPVPYRALIHLCKARELCPVTELPSGGEGTIPAHAYDAALSTIQNHDGLTPGREKTAEIDSDVPAKEREVNDAGEDTPNDSAATDGGAVAKAPGAGNTAPDYDWGRVKALYASEERGTTTQANNEAASLICEEFTFIAIRETGSVYFYNGEKGIYERRGKRYLDQQIADKLDEHYNTNRARNIREKVVNQNYISDDEFTPPEGKLCLKNGVLDLETRTLEEHDPGHNFTARLNVAYDETADVEHWDGFLAESVERESEIKKLEEFMGYCLEAWHHERHKNLFVVGPTQSGKSTFAEVVQSMFGEPPTLVNLSPQQLADTRFDSGQLKDAMLNTVNDINSSKIENSGKLKRIFAGERIKMEDKNKDPAFRAPNAKHLYTANWLPTVVGQDESLYRRILVVEFPDSVAREDRDKDLPDKLVSELSGILNRVLDARERLHEEDEFTNDRSRDDTRKLWDSWQDAHKRFLYTQFEITGDGADMVKKDVYYQAYKEFAGREGYQIKPKQAVTKSLQWVPEIGVPSEGESYTGLAWRDTDAADGGSYKPESEQAGLNMTPQDERKGKIKHTVTQFATPLEAADRQQLVDYLAGELDLGARGDLEDEIDALLANGELVEPATGKLRRT